MMLLKKIALALSSAVLFYGCKSDDVIVKNDFDNIEDSEPVDLSGSIFLDDTLRLLVYNGSLDQLPQKFTVEKDTFETSETETGFEKGKRYPFTTDNGEYVLFRTELPLITINTGGTEIVDEPKILGQMILLENGEKTFESNVGIEIRGGLSQTFPKKSYSVELWKDEVGEDTESESLLGLREDDDWILDGLWNEPLRLRDFTSHDIWLNIGRYPYKDEEEITLGIERKYCEVFINGSYRGVYYLGEKVDRKQLGLKRYDDGLKGELYKGDDWQPGTLFTGSMPIDNSSTQWNGYESEYPDDIGELDWSPLADLVNFVSTSDEKDFNDGIFELVDIQNMADYYIFVNLIYAPDNVGKNVFTGKYDSDSAYFFVAWDMDGSFGNKYDGTRLESTSDRVGNNLHKRLLHNAEFKIELKTRWNELRGDLLRVDKLQGMFQEHYDYLKGNGVYEREQFDKTLPFDSYSETEIDFINSWISERVGQLDTFFEDL